MLFAFIVGMILYGTMALLPSFLQGLMDYPVVYTGIVTAPRGIGTMLAMIVVGRMLAKARRAPRSWRPASASRRSRSGR